MLETINEHLKTSFYNQRELKSLESTKKSGAK
jgi:hypothetical protein